MMACVFIMLCIIDIYHLCILLRRLQYELSKIKSVVARIFDSSTLTSPDM